VDEAFSVSKIEPSIFVNLMGPLGLSNRDFFFCKSNPGPPPF